MNPVVVALLCVLFPSFVLQATLAIQSRSPLNLGLMGGAASLLLYTVLNMEPIEIEIGNAVASVSSLSKDLLLLAFIASGSMALLSLVGAPRRGMIAVGVASILIPLAVLRVVVWTSVTAVTNSPTGYDFDLVAFQNNRYAAVEVVMAMVLIAFLSVQCLIIARYISKLRATRMASYVIISSLIFLIMWSLSLIASVASIWITGRQLNVAYHIARSSTSISGSIAYGIGCLLFPLQVKIERWRWGRLSMPVRDALRTELSMVNTLPGVSSQDEIIDAIVLRAEGSGVEVICGGRGSQRELADFLTGHVRSLHVPCAANRRHSRQWIVGAGMLLNYAC